MEKINLGLAKMSIPAKIDFAKKITTMMTGNPSFTTPDPPLTDLTTAETALATAHSDVLLIRSEAKEKTSVMNQKEDDVDSIITQLANYVVNKSNGDVAKIESAGFTPVSDKHPVGKLPAPADLAVTSGDDAGELDCGWNPVFGAKSYIVQTNIVDPLIEINWKDALNPTKSTCALVGLTSGTRYWVRVAAIGTSGRSGWSDVATKIAP
jgi:hypothetical protein